MIPVPDAQAAYNRVTALQALPGDPALLIDAAHEPGMPVDIATLGLAIEDCEVCAQQCLADPDHAAVHPWELAYEQVRSLVGAGA